MTFFRLDTEDYIHRSWMVTSDQLGQLDPGTTTAPDLIDWLNRTFD